MEPKKLASAICSILNEKKGIDIKIIDISSITTIADYFIIAGGNNEKQVQALCDNVEDKMSEQKIFPRQIEGYNSANWILMDYEDVVVHIFNERDRLFYDLERIWRDGKAIEISDIF